MIIGTTTDGVHELIQAGLHPAHVGMVNAYEAPELVDVFWHRHSVDPATVPELYARMTNLKHVHIDMAGTDYIERFIPEGVSVTTAHETQTTGVAEWVVASVLWDAKQLAVYQRNSDRGRWAHPNWVRTLEGEKVYAYGAGRIVQRAAPVLRALGIDVIATNRSGNSQPNMTILPWKTWVQGLPRADFLLVAAPLTEETFAAIDRQTLGMLDHACLISVGRSAVIETGAIEWARRQGHLRSAVIDVHPTEPLDRGSELWDDENVLVTPHDMWRDEDIQSKRTNEFLQVLDQIIRHGPESLVAPNRDRRL